ncbi:hypothetical protein PIB30_115501 [Stylosanthes scabra]|uniref:Uncharacterized protein n=2 Tax=Stylosanthes scabra TaxID=79078 RepID=A0ABU6W1Q2_9FABA|nr:hypothetical protein [Stylosanthes scabra]
MHATTFTIKHAILIWSLIEERIVNLPKLMVKAMDKAPSSKRQLLPFPRFIMKWAEKYEVPQHPGDDIIHVKAAH